MTVDDIITGIITREGSVYTNRASDRGGPTKFGITLNTLQTYRGKQTVALDVQNLTEVEARAIYTTQYVAPWSRLTNQRLQLIAIDWSVTSGQTPPTKALQMLTGVAQDGVLGPNTIAAAQSVNPNLFACERAKFYGRIVNHDPSQAASLDGWLNRALSFVQ